MSMREGSGVFADAVVGTAPWGEVQLAGLASSPSFCEIRQQRSGCLRRQRVTEEFGLEKWILMLRRLLWLVLIPALVRAKCRPVTRRLLTGHVLAEVRGRVRAGSADEVADQVF